MKALGALLLLVAAAAAQPEGVGLDQRLGERLPPDARFVDEQGAPVRLGDYFGRRPVVLALVYYECPQLCTLILNGLVSCLKVVSLEPGTDFDVVVISIDPGEKSDLARRKKENYLRRYGHPETAAGWHFLCGEEKDIRAVADAVGYRYRYDPEHDEYIHAAGIVIATPDARLARYYYGVEFAPRDVRLGLVEASEGKLGTLVDAVLLFCFHYDPTKGAYGLFVTRLLRLGGVLTLAVMAFFIVRMLRRESRASPAAGAPGHHGRVA